MLSRSSVSSGCIVVQPHDGGMAYTFLVEAYGPSYDAAVKDKLRAIAEPISRPRLIHEYQMTAFSLGAAVSMGISADDICHFLRSHIASYQQEEDRTLLGNLEKFVRQCVGAYNQVWATLHNDGTCWVDCRSKEVGVKLLRDRAIRSQAKNDLLLEVRLTPEEDEAAAACDITGSASEPPCPSISGTIVFRFELIDIAAAKYVGERALQLGYPIQQHYDFHDDGTIPDISLTLRTSTKPREYQKLAVGAAVGTGSCTSGVIVLPCGAGKTLVGIMLMAAVQKPVLVLCASSVSVEQWKNQIYEYANFANTSETNATTAQNSSNSGGGRGRGRGRGGARGGARPTASSGGRTAEPIACITGKTKDPITASTQIVITTYTMLSIAQRLLERKKDAAAAAVEAIAEGEGQLAATTINRTKANETKLAMIQRQYGLMILDEAHVVPADFFKEAMSAVNSRATIGLTATFVREDHRIGHLFHLVGPKLYDVSWQELCAQGYLAQVTCVEVHCSMSAEFGVEYERQKKVRGDSGKLPHDGDGSCGGAQTKGSAFGAGGVLPTMAAANPNKFECVASLLARHKGSKILVFCDYILLLREYASYLKAPIICGETAHKERMKYFSDFQCSSVLNVLCVSRVGDVSVNLPAASVVIQVSSQGGSRRQEAQRLGRILRPKDRAADGSIVHAYFYSLVSDGTVEGQFAARRTRFLINQGYDCRLALYPFETDSNDAVEGSRNDDATRLLDPMAEAAGALAPKSTIKVEVDGGRRLVNAADLERAGTGSRVADSRWRVAWLAKVVSQWELETRPLEAKRSKMMRKRRRRSGQDSVSGGDDDDDDDELTEASSSSSSSSDSSVQIVDPAEAAKLKDEERGADTDLGGSTVVDIGAWTFGEDDVVYHEFR